MLDTESEINESKSSIEIYNAICVGPSKMKPWHTFVYIDSVQYLADKIFQKYGLRVWVFDELISADGKYVAVGCRVRKRRVADFLKAMEELQRNMIICGYLDYEELCRKIERAIQEDGEDD